MISKQILRRAPCNTRPFATESHPLLARVYARREGADPLEAEAGLRDLLPVDRLKGIDAAVSLLLEALERNQAILIVGDFDADGATSCALAVTALRAFGAARVDYLVPNRFTYGYGLTPQIVELARPLKPELLITVDNGISSVEGVAAAQSCGMRVLITDHHLPGAQLPAADAIVNPNLPDDGFASKHLAGVGVIFYVMLALRARLRERGWFAERGQEEPKLADLLDLVALGTVADVAQLDRNNRILVEQGVRRIRAGRTRPGILALLAIAGRDHRRIVAADLGFAVGPRLNAAGRLEDMSLGIECLLSDDADRARKLAVGLEDLNRQRREIESQMQIEALAVLEQIGRHWVGDRPPAGICLMDAGWHQGVIGILASRLKERFNRPVIAFAPAGEGELKGSARSIDGLHMRDLLDSIAARNPGLVERFGGHAMAAGLSIRSERFASFEAAFAAAVAAAVDPKALEGVVLSDGELEPGDFTLTAAEALRAGGPWGQGFAEPVFDGVFEIGQARIVGERHVKFSLGHPDRAGWLDAIAFNGVQYGWHELAGRVRAVYRLDVNEFRGRRDLQLIIDYMADPLCAVIDPAA